MADLVALGAASNVVQFVHFGACLFSEARDAYKSVHGAGDEHLELETVSQDLQSLSKRLQNAAQPPSLGSLSGDDRDLRKLAGSCEKLAQDLLKLLNDLKLKGLHHRRWESFKQALKHARKASEIRGLENRLSRFQAQITTHLLAMLSERQSTVMSAIRSLAEANSQLELNTMGRLDELRSQLVDLLEQKDSLNGLEAKISQLFEEGKKVGNQQKVLASLSFKCIQARYDSIQKEHAETFKWIFKSSQIRFAEWLRSGQGVYWLGGKAGSGKSTLMKFLVKHEFTKSSLDSWAEHDRLCIASHFFWASGSEMQKSQKGLIQTLLFQILRQCPDLIPKVAPERCESNEDCPIKSWSYEELFQAMNLLAQQTLSTKFCFFVDGLDEYTGNHTELILLLKQLALSPSIKLCVSSRPWNAFVHAFGHHGQQLQLEDLTRNDIEAYVKGRLECGLDHSRLEVNINDYSRIVEEVVIRARGVFFWVRLVVDSLLRGLEEGDGFLDMWNRLNSLPDGLEEYFRSILSTIDPIYRQQTARIFQICIHAEQPLPVLAFAFLEEEQKNPNYALEADIRPISEAEVDDVQLRMKKYLRARCKDLLEISPGYSPRSFLKHEVNFAHKTVRDFFLTTSAMESILKTQTLSNADVQVSLWRIILALAKALPSTGDFVSLPESRCVLLLAAIVMSNAHETTEPEGGRRIIATKEDFKDLRLLEELERVFREWSERELCVSVEHLVRQYADPQLHDKLMLVLREHREFMPVSKMFAVMKRDVSINLDCIIKGVVNHPHAGLSAGLNIEGLAEWGQKMLDDIIALLDDIIALRRAETRLEGITGNSQSSALRRCIDDYFGFLERLSLNPQFYTYLYSAKDSLQTTAILLEELEAMPPQFYEWKGFILQLAILTTGTPYVRKMLEGNPSELLCASEPGRPYLDYGLRPSITHPMIPVLKKTPCSAEMLRFLLEEKHQDPNEHTTLGETVWTGFLEDTYNRKTLRDAPEHFYNAFKLMIDHGADPDASFKVDSNGKTHRCTLVDVVKAKFPEAKANHLEQLLEDKKRNRKMKSRKRWFLMVFGATAIGLLIWRTSLETVVGRLCRVLQIFLILGALVRFFSHPEWWRLSRGMKDGKYIFRRQSRSVS